MSPHRDMNGDRDARIEELLRSSLHEEADTVVPAGDGLSRIQRRVTSGRSRQRWLRPLMALGSAAIVFLAGLGVYSITNNPNKDNAKVTVNNSGTPTPTASETTAPAPSETTVPIAGSKFPKLAIFPFTNAADEKTWEGQYAGGHSPWEADATAVATMWVNNILEQPSVDRVISKMVSVDGNSTTVTLGRVVQGGSSTPISVTAVQLVKFGNAWIVVRADDPAAAPYQLKISSPAAGTLAMSPLAVTGPGFGVDEAANVDVRDATTPTSYGVGHTGSFGAGTPTWQASVSFSQPTGPDGVLVALEPSAADGGPQRIVARQLQFGEASGSSTPAYFYAIKNGRVTKFHSSDGSAVSYLTDAQPGGGAADPQLNSTGDIVYFLQGAGTCANALESVTVGGAHATQTVASPDAGYVIAGYGILDATPANAVAYYEQACDAATSPQAKLVMRTSSGSTHTVNFPSEPPTVMADPAWETDGAHVDAFVRTGTAGYLARYSATSGTSAQPSGQACPSYNENDGEPQAIEVDGAGTLWFATRTGSSMQVVQCSAGTSTVAFTVSGNDQPADVDVTSNGQGVLLTDTAGKVWRWDGSGQATALSPAVALDHVTW